MIPVGYLAAIGIALMFTLYLDGGIGVMMLAFLLVMPLLSLSLTLIGKRGMEIRIQLPDECSKGKQIEASLTLTKKTPLPMPFLRLRFYADAHFAPLNASAAELPEPPMCDPNAFLGELRYHHALRLYEKHCAVQHTPDMLPFCFTMGLQREYTCKILLDTRYCGSGEVWISHGELTDFLRLFRFRLHKEPRASVLILPMIPSIQPDNRLFRSVANEAVTADEESEATPVFSASATPGYEHRDYFPGDSLKRVNWKLSSKRHRLMVRKDEPAALAKLTVILDFHRNPSWGSMKKCLAAEQLLIEGALGMLSLCLRQGYPCVLYYQDENAAWTQFSADMPEQVATESVRLLRGGFRSGYALAQSPALPPAVAMQNDLILMCFSTGAGDSADAVEQLNAVVHLVHPVDMPGGRASTGTTTVWQINEEHRLIPLQS